MKIEYTKMGDYYIPNLVAPRQMKNFKIGKYGLLRLRYLKENKNALYQSMLMKNKLQKHLMYIDKMANDRVNELINKLAEKENITEKLKATNQMEWVGKMNNIKNRAEEIIIDEIIYE